LQTAANQGIVICKEVTMKRTVFITGASSGFGAACARRFADCGDRLILAARRENRLLAMRDYLAGKAEVHIAKLDVRDSDAVKGAVELLPEEFREVDILINSAGLALGLEPAHEARLEEWEEMVDTNIKGLLHVTRLILPGMVERNRGHIINIGSVAANWPYPGGNAYGASKAFVEQFSRNLRADLLGASVRVTCISPGMAETEFSLVRFRGEAERAAKVYAGVDPLTADDIAESVCWVTSLPAHVNVNSLELMPVQQAWGPLAVHRKS
jgi:NADP-dependent 3-hydroxy acid dehydrogenase YdfG